MPRLRLAARLFRCTPRAPAATSSSSHHLDQSLSTATRAPFFLPEHITLVPSPALSHSSASALRAQLFHSRYGPSFVAPGVAPRCLHGSGFSCKGVRAQNGHGSGDDNAFQSAELLEVAENADFSVHPSLEVDEDRGVLSHLVNESQVDGNDFLRSSDFNLNTDDNAAEGAKLLELDEAKTFSLRLEHDRGVSLDPDESLEDGQSTLRSSDFSSRSRSSLVCGEHEVNDSCAFTTGTDESEVSELEDEAEADASELELEETNTLELVHGTDDETKTNEAISEHSGLDVLETQEPSDLVPLNGPAVEEVKIHEKQYHGRSYLHELSVDEVREILEKARAKDVRILPVRNHCEWTDHLVFASGRSTRHLRGMADALVYKVKKCSENVGPNSFPTVEGRDGEQWMAVDCGNMVVHLFLEDARSYYNLEEFWVGKAKPRLVEAV